MPRRELPAFSGGNDTVRKVMLVKVEKRSGVAVVKMVRMSRVKNVRIIIVAEVVSS